MNPCLANPCIFSWVRKLEQTGIALDRVSSEASHGWVTKGMDSCVLFSIPRPFFFSFPLKIKSGGSLTILADLSFRCASSCLPSPTLQGFDRTRLILEITVRSKLIASRGCKACLSPSPYGLKLSRQFASTEALEFSLSLSLLTSITEHYFSQPICH